jgi:hypothetical protein
MSSESIEQQIEYEKQCARRFREQNAISDENKFWIIAWALVALVLISVIGGITANSISENQKIGEFVQRGYSPAEAGCAFPNNQNTQICQTLAATIAAKQK